MDLIPKIKECREKAKYSQTELAKELEITRSYMSRLESGKKYPEIHLLWQIAKICNCLVDDLYEEL